MWQDSDFKEAFNNYSPTPPKIVWDNIAYRIERDQPKSPGFWAFNPAQKFTLLAACIVSIFISSFVIKHESESVIDSSNHIIAQKDIYTGNIIIEENENVEINKPLNQQKILSNYNHIQKNEILVRNKLNRKLNLPDELKPFEKEINELHQIDLAIANLTKELNVLKKVNDGKSNLEINYLSTNSVEKERERELIVYKETSKEEQISSPSKIKSNFFQDFVSKLYLTPFVGSNFTQVSYTKSSNNPYFSQNANFNGNIGYTSGIQLGYQFNKKWSIESGISFGQYIQSFQETMQNNSLERNGVMYIDQLDFPLLARYSMNLNQKKKPLVLSLKAGLIYNSVVKYQVNYLEQFLNLPPMQNTPIKYNFEADKRTYNSLQFGYAFGLDIESQISKKFALNASILNAYVSQLENFPSLSSDISRPRQFSTTFSIGTKLRF